MPRKAPVDPHNQLKTAEFKVGPYKVAAKSAMEGKNVFLPRPEPTETIEVAHFGSFVPTFANGTEIPRNEFYLHHILAYDSMSGDFVAGCSDERTNWGPDMLPYPYRLVLKPQASVRANGFHMNSLKDYAIEFYITYKVLYKVHVPTDPEVRVVRSLVYLDNYSTPGGQARNSTHVRKRHNTVPRDMVLVSINGHLHQGGKRLILEFDDKQRVANDGNVIAISYNLYNDNMKCFWDCDIACPYENDWPSQWATTTAYMELPLHAGEKLISTAEYDNSCVWHAVMAWWFGFGWSGEKIGASITQ